MRIIGYVRVSSRSQVLDGLGLEVQEEAIRAWVKAEGHELVAIESDEGVSGAKESIDRPGLSRAFMALEDDEADGLVVYRLDRLARALHIQETSIAWAAKHHRRILSIQEDGIDEVDITRVLVRQILGAIAEYERGVIKARMEAGKFAKIARGGYGGGAPGYGQRVENKELVPDAAERRTIARARELHADGLSLRAIGNVLESEGHRPKRGQQWHAKTVARLLDRHAEGGREATITQIDRSA